MLSLFHSFATQMQPIMTTDPTTTMTTTNTNAAMPTGVLVTYLVAMGIFIVLAIVCNWIIFTKLGEKGWKSIIPIYSSVIFLRLGNQSPWWLLVSLVPFLGAVVLAVVSAFAAYTIGLKLHRPGWFVVLYILISPIWYVILAFSNSTGTDGHVDTTGFVSGADMTPPPFSPTTPTVPTTPTSTPHPAEQPSDTPSTPPVL